MSKLPFSGKGLSERINVIPLDQWSLNQKIKSDSRKNRDRADVSVINIDDLTAAYGELSLQNVRDHATKLGELDFLSTLKKSVFVEDDSIFEWDHKYIVVFNDYLASYGQLPNFEQFWIHWKEMNEPAFDYNLSSLCRPYREDGDPGKISAVSNMILSQKVEADVAIAAIADGAELRAKRFCAAAIREIDVLLHLTEPLMDDFDNEYAPCEVWTHPLIDCACKYDGITVAPDGTSVAVAICLDSDFSNSRAGLKSENIPDYFKENIDRGIGLHVRQNMSSGIYFATNQNLLTLRQAIAGETAAFRILQGSYTWKGLTFSAA